MTETFYSILGCSENATYEEIKRNYQQLVKTYHPDKHASHFYDQFLKIDEAWKTLRDAALRRQYDASLIQKKFSEQYLVYATLNVNELDFDDDLVAYYPCRCGTSYTIDKKLIEDESVIECDECSYVIVVNNKIN